MLFLTNSLHVFGWRASPSDLPVHKHQADVIARLDWSVRIRRQGELFQHHAGCNSDRTSWSKRKNCTEYTKSWSLYRRPSPRYTTSPSTRRCDAADEIYPNSTSPPHASVSSCDSCHQRLRGCPDSLRCPRSLQADPVPYNNCTTVPLAPTTTRPFPPRRLGPPADHRQRR